MYQTPLIRSSCFEHGRFFKQGKRSGSHKATFFGLLAVASILLHRNYSDFVYIDLRDGECYKAGLLLKR